MDNIIDGVYCLNADGYFIYVNNVILERSGITRDQFYRLHFLDIVDPEFHDQVKRNFERVMKGEKIIPYELKYKTPGGKIITVEVHSKPLYEGKKLSVCRASHVIYYRTQTVRRRVAIIRKEIPEYL